MKLTFVLRNRKNALKVSTKTIESFIERIKTDTKDGAVTRRRKQLSYGDYIEGYDRQYPSHLIYPSAEFEKDANDNLRMKIFNGIVALTVEGLDTAAEIDAVKQMAQMLLINLDEFNQISPHTQQGFLKNIITLSSVKIKRPYGRHVEDFPRRASFIATTNQADVLADPSGSRRFLSVELKGPIDVSTPPNYEQLYAQAMRALHQHEPYYFGPAETQEILEWNRQFSVKSSADLLFLDYFEPAIDEQDGTWMSASAIFSYLKEKVGVSLLKPTGISAFGRKLTNLPGLKKRETKYNTEYLVRLKKR